MVRNQVKRVHMSESAFQDKILDLCKWHRLKVFHVYDSRKSAGPGFPDLVIVGKSGTLFAELKSTTGKVSTLQTEWIEALQVSGERVHVWRPEDWDEVQQVLKELGG